MTDTIEIIMHFAFYYPLFMAYVWMIGALYYRFHWETVEGDDVEHPKPLASYPPVSILLPCYNEGELVEETIGCLFEQTYPNFEVIAINDGSSDNTGELLNQLEKQYPNLRVVHLATNQGKATAMNAGAMLSKNEFLIGIDGDAILDAHAVHWLMSHFTSGSARVGAVTGNPRIRNRTTLLGKIQVGEFSSIIGMIKRAQRIYGRVFTVSGVVVAFRRTALQRIGYWSTDMVTEDIDVSWRLQLDHWDVRYEPNALCWILMPETLKGLWRQRVRWAQGGMEVFKRYFSQLFSWRKRRMWMVALEYLVSVIWSYTAATIIVLWVLGKFVELPQHLYIQTIVPGWNGVILGITCLCQFAVSLAIDSRYDKGLGRYYYWMIWYPLIYWMINTFTIVYAVPKALAKKDGQLATWKSPDRGVQSR
ncbi:MAG: poly-beta-1,6-N-acetyl-D-glucosamine synthase [Pseudomonadales bacterium]|nr:poly-beta-1,6-N-acetyl-D-glucosamine synthase [Pseudomonadales bacterium]